MARDLQEIIDRVVEKQEHVERLKREHAFMLALLVGIEETIDKSITLYAYEQPDFQQISVGIKRLRGLLGSEKIMDPGMVIGLIREG